MDCAMELKKQYLRNLAAKRAEILSGAVETGAAGAELPDLEGDIEICTQLRDCFERKKLKRPELRR